MRNFFKALTKPRIQLQIASDFHLEYLRSDPYQLLKPVAPNLALLGDIGSVDKKYVDFLYYCSNHFERVMNFTLI